MFYLIPIPIIFIAVIVKLISQKGDLKIFNTISNVIICIGIILFLYLFADYKGFNILNIIADILM